jgi:hypothetical protein
MTTTLTLTYTGTLTITECGVCAVPHAIPQEMYADRLNNGGNWWCPNGHKLHFITTEAQKLEKQLAQEKRYRGWAETRATSLRDQLDAAERSRSALKGHLTRARNKIANGVCPVGNCRRHFDNVQEHIASEHPQWHVTDPETGKAAVL